MIAYGDVLGDCSRAVRVWSWQAVQTQFSSGDCSPCFFFLNGQHPSEMVKMVRRQVKQPTSYQALQTQVLFFIFAASVVLKSFSCCSSNQTLLTALRTNELKMTDTIVISVNCKTYASQLSGSAVWLLLQTERVFKVHLRRGGKPDYLSGQKGCSFPQIKRTGCPSGSGNAPGQMHRLHFSLRGIQFDLSSLILDFLMVF